VRDRRKTTPWIRELAFEALRQAKAGLTVVRVIVGWQFIIERVGDTWTVRATALYRSRFGDATVVPPRQVYLFLRALARGGGAGAAVVACIPEQPVDRVITSWRVEASA
jgi:hypothetical protein